MATDFTVLSDAAVQALFRAFTKDDVKFMAEALRSAFHAYSTAEESKYQLHRSAITRPSGRTTLFMPSTLEIGSSVKMVGVPAPGEDSTLRCTLTICDNIGQCIGVINAGEFTAFRTSLGAMLIFDQRTRVGNIVIFGAGKQAFWHLRLAIILRGKNIECITVINRSQARGSQMVHRVKQECGNAADHIVFHIVEAGDKSREHTYHGDIQCADVIFCTTPSTEPLFSTEVLAASSQSKRYISAIGSYRLDMQEIPPDYLQWYTKLECREILVDSGEAAYLEAGEIVKADIKPEHILEMGQLVERERTTTGEAVRSLQDWLENDNVVYKSVGLGIMDLALGKALIDLARERGVGVRLVDF
ncbi:ornithine cyclodeaminase/mu-crystallin family protein [Pseudovirgaria hyperparasitica]|uniref:Ornithine cyclodeaminase/mu-crystallin family protein n=1 Tax=Pseudovirgaria hyperparasitica TaxID=470096 RepID=A0A6A6WJN1_9PEZI|nr:ornithine cyclodeaminase/mu-crystallin family protein [Pseudovirgaria hyperparasitica]KAF2762456.1 ornithine cyclodeaminase/mu-crystallin family protein [Pseudovirgaria hyperparasitica]